MESEDVDGDAVNKTADTYQYVFPFFDEVGFKPGNAAVLGTPISFSEISHLTPEKNQGLLELYSCMSPILGKNCHLSQAMP